MTNKYGGIVNSPLNDFDIFQVTGEPDSLIVPDLRAGTVLLFIPTLIPGRRGTMETATTISTTGYVRWSQARHETSPVEIILNGQ